MKPGMGKGPSFPAGRHLQGKLFRTDLSQSRARARGCVAKARAGTGRGRKLPWRRGPSSSSRLKV